MIPFHQRRTGLATILGEFECLAGVTCPQLTNNRLMERIMKYSPPQAQAGSGRLCNRDPVFTPVGTLHPVIVSILNTIARLHTAAHCLQQS
jgi:hypothetical protein